jgi:hypothetical protein
MMPIYDVIGIINPFKSERYGNNNICLVINITRHMGLFIYGILPFYLLCVESVKFRSDYFFVNYSDALIIPEHLMNANFILLAIAT